MASPALSATVPRSIRPLLWWHLLSLDAPSIAALWCALFSAAFGVQLPLRVLMAIALAVWALYVLDRILDGFGPLPEHLPKERLPKEHLKDRHYFYARHRRLFVPLLIAVGAVLTTFLKRGTILLPTALHDFFALGIFLALYYLLIHAFRRQTRWFPKELAVGVFFSCAISVPTWVRLTPAQRHTMILSVVALGLLCWLNCIAITRWETSSEPLPHARVFWLLAAACILCSCAGMLQHAVVPIFTATLASTAALIWLECNRPRFSSLALRIAADCALLTPILVLPMLLR